MNPDWVPPRLRGPVGVVFCAIAVALLALSAYRTFGQDDVIGGSFVGLMGGGWFFYGIWFWQHRLRR